MKRGREEVGNERLYHGGLRNGGDQRYDLAVGWRENAEEERERRETVG